MVKHIVLWKIKDDENKQNNIDHMIKILTGLVGKIDGLVSAEMGYNFNTDSDYDVVLYATLKNAVALKYYQNHPEHLKCKEFIGKIAVDRVAADYFFEEEISAVKSFDEVPDAPDETVVNDNVSVAPNKLPLTAAPTPIVDSIPVEPAPASGVDSAPVEPTPTPIPSGSSVPLEAPNKESKKSFFKKKNDDIQITPVEQRAGSWTCPNCGKVMPDYVGTCGCGEPKPFENTFNSNDISSAPNNEPVSAPVQTVKPASVSAPVEMPKKENGKSFFKKKNDDIQITPVEQRAGSWTCPNCGKVMPDYVGTCGCGEPKPFENTFNLNDISSAPNNEPVSTPVQTVKPASVSAPVEMPKKENGKSFFKKKNDDIQITPVEQRAGSWTCPNCGKVMPDYVGTCGCGEPKPFENTFNSNDISSASNNEPVSAPVQTVKPASVSAPVEMPKKENGKSFFKKKNDDIQITPVEQRAGSWTCPNCGKVMPDYVGTCGCGEPKPFENTFNSNDISSAPNNEPVSAPVQTVKPASVSAPVEMPKKENGKSFFKKKNDDIQITPVEQRAGSWTCPNCGKVMPDYVGTCGCGEPKPFDNVHFTQNYTAVTSNNIQTDVPKAESVNKSSKPFFSKNTVEKQPLNIDTAQNSDTWICPKCGKILPNYVGTCGCGEPKPFENFSKYNDISINHLSSESNLPDIQQKENSQNSNATPIYKINEKFASVEPSLQSYNPQVKNTEPQTMQQQDLNFIKNDKEQETNVNNNFNAQDLSFIKSSENSLDESKPYAENQTILEQPKKTSIDELDSPMKFTDTNETQENAEPVQSFSFDNVPPPAPMRFNDAPPASLHLNDTENLSPVNNNNVQPSPINYNAPTIRQNISPVFSKTDVPQVKHEKYEKKHRFGKKAKEEAVIQKAVQAVSERKDIPSNTWTCPNCGKVMPKYVGTCGCGEQQPFDD